MIEPKLEASVGMSRKWDAREAGRDVAETAIKNLGEPPSFFLLFSTIHYEKYGGFQELLNGIWDVLPQGTPLIGGTVTGFANNFGCYARGVTALTVSYPEMDVVIGYGKNTKRSPKNAARQCVKMIKDGLKNSNYENKFLLNLISAAEVPNIPFLGRRKIIKPGVSTKAIMQLFGFSQYVLQKGAGRDDEVLDEMIKLMPDYNMLGGGTVDDGAGFTNFQFYDKSVFKNSVVSLGLKTRCHLDVLTTHNMKKTGINFKITKASKDGRMIYKINGKPAASELLRLLNWPKEDLIEETWFKRNYHFPLGFHINDNTNIFGPRVIVGIYGETLITTIRSKDPEASILTIDGRNLLDTIDCNLNSFQNRPDFGLISSCSTRLITLGDKVYQSRDKILKYFGDRPFVVFYVGGESTYSPQRGLNFVNMSFNTALFWNDYTNIVK